MRVNRNKLVFTLIGVFLASGVVYGLFYREFYKVLEPKDYLTWVNSEENGLIKNSTIENYSYRCQFLPIDYFFARYQNLKYPENQKNGLKNTISLAFEILPKLVDDAILSPDIIGHEKYSERLQYLNSIAISDFKLVSNKDTINCTNLNYENPFNLSRNLKIMLEFDHSNAAKQEDFTLIYEDNLLGGGIIKFHFNGSDLSSIPKLKTI